MENNEKELVKNEEDNSVVKEYEKEDSPEEEKNVKKEILSWVKIFVGAFIVAYILSTFVIVNARVPSGSMTSTINPGDKVIGFRLSYTFGNPKRGDIVMFKAPDKKDTIYIKRIVGLPGDEIKIEDNKLYINGELLEEDYIKKGWNNNPGTFPFDANGGMAVNGEQASYTFVVPKGRYYMMGDNRNGSSDSRVWGSIKKDDIIAKAIFRYYPSIKSLLD